MKTNNYNIEKILDCLENRGYTNFLNQQELMMVKGKLHKNQYHIYELYQDSNKVILYKTNKPLIKLYRINNSQDLRHQDILGTIFSLGIAEDMFGDIFRYKGEFYIFIMPLIEEYLKYNLVSIKNNNVSLEEVVLSLACNFKQEYIEKEIIVSSLRIDNVIANLIHCNRNDILTKFKDKEIILNYNIELKPTRVLRENDVFSIKRVGKYKFGGIIKNTKKGGYIVLILMYK